MFQLTAILPEKSNGQKRSDVRIIMYFQDFYNFADSSKATLSEMFDNVIFKQHMKHISNNFQVIWNF